MNNKIKKRNGEIVEFSPDKITSALRKAYKSSGIDVSEEKLSDITKKAIAHLDMSFPEATPSVEDVQNIVERILMVFGDFPVAKSYIIYRYEHQKIREEKQQEIMEKIEQNDLLVTKRSGKKEKFSSRKLKRSLTWVVRGLENSVDADLIVEHTETNLYDGITTKEISKALILATRGLIERDPAYSKVAARMLFDSVYKDAIGPENIDYAKLDQQYRQAFIDNIRKGIELERLDKRLLNFDLEKMATLLKPERDDLFMYLGGQTLTGNYFITDPDTKRVLETPQAFWLRVSMGLALNEADQIGRTESFYNILSTLRFVSSTPTLVYAGTPHPQLSSCYLTTIDDSLDHIFKCLADNAQLSKWSGGVANDWTNLRATGAFIKGTGVSSQGTVPFLKIANDTTVAINRSGRRRGATCAYMETWHYDIEDFLELRKNTGDDRRRTHDMNTANWIPDLFMKRVEADQTWTLMSPDEAPDLHHLYGKKFEERYEQYEEMARTGKLKLFKTVKAKDLWKKMIVMLFETGHPWMTWKDPSNVRSPQDHVGVVHSSNLCTEITLNTSPEETAVCNLGSINLARHVKDGRLDVELIKETTTIAMRMLDNVVDVNFYPTIEAKNSNLKHRPVGLGVMGFQDALYQMGVNFDTPACVEFSDECQEIISYYAILASSDLAAERGTYQSYPGSKWDRGIFPIDTLGLLEAERGEKIMVDRSTKLDWRPVREAVKKNGMRNSNCMALAPTATIANIAGCFPTIEPIYKNVYVKSNMSGEFIIVNPYLVEDLKKINLWNQDMLERLKGNDGSLAAIAGVPDELKAKYKEVFDIEPEWLIKAAAYRGKWIDQSQSLNLYFRGTSGKKISDMYQYAWKMGLKTTYYLRTLGATAVEKSTIELSKQNNLSQVTSSSNSTGMGGVQQPAVTVQELQQQLDKMPVMQATAAQAEQPVAASVASAVMASVAAASTAVASALTPTEVAPVEVATVDVMPTKLMLCKIDDPDCEACQ